MVHIDFQVNKNCWNLYDSYGGICVGCGCCSRDKATRYRARLDTVKNWLEEKQTFDLWDDDPELRAIQERNNRSWIRHFKSLIRYYERRLREVEEEQRYTEAMEDARRYDEIYEPTYNPEDGSM